ncbi:response regulator transcription factor [Ktedonosporobacter rubrisoli]|uniref:Response regulator transcription factor n=1 Tax=Ktedonosporobacter rubrisoli TaxID=2509675 RepID=A0A4P6K2Z6_KTERU|nr:response regulator transcription factor [Ktedonosporobacter rubrisoli]QBD82100.1 response regulator transcription factor [Ktedonosporobacter rubrisoli]
MRLLLIEDDSRLSQSLKISLEEEGYAVDAVYDGVEGEIFALSTAYDVIILDIMLPRKDGVAVCRTLRNNNLRTPILLLTARDAVEDRVQGLDSGADDYLIKPFAFYELLARLRALLRRNAPQKKGVLVVGDLQLDPATHQVERRGERIKVNAKEFALLEYFMRNPNQVLTREMIENHIWNYDFISVSNVVDVYVRRLRRKVDDPYSIKVLETVYGLGYRLRWPERESEG